MSRTLILLVLALLAPACARVELPTARMEPIGTTWDPFLDTLQARTITFFLETTDTLTGMALDRYPSPSPSSIAAVGFALTIYPIAAERGIITREEAARRTRNTLRYFCGLPQGDAAQGMSGYRGFYYHFLKTSNGAREWNCELSTVDTGLLMAGMLFAQTYFHRPDELERQIRQLADTLYRRVEWAWTSTDEGGIKLAWDPERGFHGDTWRGYNEAMILYILAFGSPTHPVSRSGWDHWTSQYVWGEYNGLEFVNFGPLFGHQYSHCWIDFRGIRDRYMQKKGIDYFENSRRATYTHREYGRQNPSAWRDYADSIWGWTACDGPGDTTITIVGKERKFRTYSARGVSIDWVYDDGTIAPTAAASSIPFAPEICIPALKAMARKYGARLWRPYGFADAFNPSFVTASTPNGWFDRDHLGIDQGPIVLMIENYRNGMVWETMKKNPYVRDGLREAGFTGGWIDKK